MRGECGVVGHPMAVAFDVGQGVEVEDHRAQRNTSLPAGAAESHQKRPARQDFSCVIGMRIGWPTSQGIATSPNWGIGDAKFVYPRKCQL